MKRVLLAAAIALTQLPWTAGARMENAPKAGAARPRPPAAPQQPAPDPAQPGGEPAKPAPQRAVFLFNLSDFHGDVKGGFLRLAYDRAHDEVYVMGGGDVRVFGETGMEVYRFGDAQGVPYARTLAPLSNGDLIAVTAADNGMAQFVRCNYRGEVKGPFPFTGLPPGVWAGIDEIRAVKGRLYFLDTRKFRVVVTDEEGRYVFHRDLQKAIFRDVGPDAEETAGQETEITGFDVDDKGNFVITIAVQFRGLAISPQLDVRPFGGKGSRPGKFNIAGAVAHDEDGNLYVADTMRSVIMVFSPDLKFLFQFGGRGLRPGRLLLPYSIAVGNGKAFVSQGGTRGIAVFKIE